MISEKDYHPEGTKINLSLTDQALQAILRGAAHKRRQPVGCSGEKLILMIMV
ncbi:MAG: hypothetical protein AAF621_02640 [Pseudomonadota bacterium]